MDDKQFDHIVKEKLESLSPPYKEGAWSALDYRLDLLAPLPWYARWQSLLIAGTLGVITLLNIGLLYKADSDQDLLKQLLNEIKEERKAVLMVDTVFVVTEKYLGSPFMGFSSENELIVSASNRSGTLDFLSPLTIYRITERAGGQPVSLVNTPAIPIANTNSEAILDLYRPVTTVQPLNPFNQEYQMSTPNGDEMFVRGVVLPPEKRKWDHPLDPRVGISVGYLLSDPDIGERYVNSRQSLLIETPIRGNFHFLTGLSFQNITYKLDDVDDNNFEISTLLKYPDFGTFSTTPDEIRVENRMLQVPLYLRYYKPLNRNWSVFAGAGPTIDILLNQKFTYSFLDIRNEQLVRFDETRESKEVKITLGSLSGNIGVEHYFSRRLSAQIELNYQLGLGSIGLESRSFNSFALSGGLFYKLNLNRNR